MTHILPGPGVRLTGLDGQNQAQPGFHTGAALNLVRAGVLLVSSLDRVRRLGQVSHHRITHRYNERDTYPDRDLNYR